MKNVLIILFFLQMQIHLLGQTSSNLIPNHSFQFGSSNPDCYNTNANFGKIYDWKNAELDPTSWYWGTEKPTSDWYAVANTGCNYAFCAFDFRSILSSNNRFVGFGQGGNDVFEGVRAKLKSPLKSNTTYKFRIKCYFAPTSPYWEKNNHIRIHFAKKEDRWNLNDNDNVRLSDAITIRRTPNIDDCTWKIYERYFSFGSDFNGQLKNIIIMAEDEYTFIDDVELYEFCTEFLTRQNREYLYKQELEEAINIIAGEKVSTSEPEGTVICFPDSKLEYKAANEVNLKPGFEVQRGADFTAKIAPCGVPCILPSFGCKKYQSICSNECINIGCTPQPLMTYQWTSVPYSNTELLDCVNCPNPIFCPPTGTTGIFKYKVLIKNACGDIKEEEITINITAASSPVFTLENTDLTGIPKFKIVSDPINTETVKIEILDCQENVFKLYTKDAKNTALVFPLEWQLNDYDYDPCACYKIKISTKNFCNEAWYSETIDWDLTNVPYQLNALQNVLSCASNNLNQFFNVPAVGAKKIKIEFFNRWGGAIIPQNTNGDDMVGWQDYKNNIMSFKFPNSICNGTFFYILQIEGCDGVVRSYNGSITRINCCGETTLPPKPVDGDIYTFNPANGLTDSLYSALVPNPVTVEQPGIINYHLPESGNVKITLFNSNMTLINQFVNETKEKGDYTATLNIDQLTFGSAYYKIELIRSNGTTLYELRRFMVNK